MCQILPRDRKEIKYSCAKNMYEQMFENNYNDEFFEQLLMEEREMQRK
jgi:hypothetical protein